jgi:hypothetical protein
MNIIQRADSVLIALTVGCLPSFAIFIRGRVEAVRESNFNAIPEALSKTYSNIQSSQTKSQIRAGSFLLEDIELQNGSRDGGSNKTSPA